MDWSNLFADALPYDTFLDHHASEIHRTKWNKMHGRIRLSDSQRDLVVKFSRRMPVLCLAGAWCGDCVEQVPMFDHFAQTNPNAIDLRLLDRDAQPELRDALTINGGKRVPMVVFLSEDFQEVARFGDRTLTRYRRLAADQLGPSCPIGLVPPSDELLSVVVSEWLDQFERAQLILRLSPRLRERHGD